MQSFPFKNICNVSNKIYECCERIAFLDQSFIFFFVFVFFLLHIFSQKKYFALSNLEITNAWCEAIIRTLIFLFSLLFFQFLFSLFSLFKHKKTFSSFHDMHSRNIGGVLVSDMRCELSDPG